ncbi:hypothetical protein HX089_17345 [Myroides odoratimimus]|uniref:hypothetical protein n=1 Tax=Myroides odoratimimus TaxID=76832 RepID=UPI002574BCCC|nr:hypothetical protein [Myroides odoratimimus]MDM1456747.1 hypothetical protein [Myroides odoratimimus]MDM1518112.1 hypothetical protein [Myroides odoratimimus]
MNNNIPNNVNDEIAIIDESQLKQFQSLYYLIKGKRDTDIKLFTEFKQFSFVDVLELNDKVYKVLELHQMVTDIVNVTIGLENKEIKTFGSWNEFKNTDWNISARTKYITIEWDFNLLFQNQFHNVPQTHTMRVRIGNSLRPSEMIQVVFQGGDEYEFEEAQAQMSCRIDFINAQICNQLKATVNEWYDSLPKNSEDHKLIKFILKHEGKIRNFVVFSLISSSIIFLNYLFNVSIKNNIEFLPKDTNQKMFLFYTVSIGVFYVFYKSGQLLSNKMMVKQINKLKRNPMFEFTKGDKNRFIEVKKDNKKLVQGLFVTILIGLSTNGLSAFIGYIIELLVKD